MHVLDAIAIVVVTVIVRDGQGTDGEKKYKQIEEAINDHQKH